MTTFALPRYRRLNNTLSIYTSRGWTVLPCCAAQVLLGD